MDEVKKLSTAGKVVKFILLFTNTLVMLFGLILIGVGAAGLANQFTVLTSITLASGIIVIGVLLLLISFVGCWGALKENRKFLIAFFCLVLFFVIIQFGVGIAAYVMRADLPMWADQTWSFFYANERSVIDTAENQFQCCGFKETADRAVPPTGNEETCAKDWYPNSGACSTAIYDNIQLLYTSGSINQSIALASGIEATEGCCGWTSVNDGEPWSPCPGPWTVPCYNQINSSWIQHYNMRSAAGDNYIKAYEKNYTCCGYTGATIYQVPPYYNDTCVATKNYTQPCEQVITNAVLGSLGAIGGVCIALAIVQLFTLAITIYMIRAVPRTRRDELDMPPPQEMIDEE